MNRSTPFRSSLRLAIGLLPFVLIAATPNWTCFGAPRAISPAGIPADLSFNFKESLATLEDGSVHAVWHADVDGIRRVFYSRSTTDGRTWETPRPLSSPHAPSEHPSIAASADHVHVGWHEHAADGSSTVVYRRSTDRGRHFGPPQPLAASGRGVHVSLAADASRVQAVWMDTRSGVSEIFVRSSRDGGAHFEPELQLSPPRHESWVPNVDVDGDIAVVAWVDYRDANEEEYLRVSTDAGASWEPAVRVTNDPADSWAPSVVVHEGTVLLAWFDRRTAGVSDHDVEAPLDAAMKLLGLPLEPAPARDPDDYYLPAFVERLGRKSQAIAAALPAWVDAGGDPRTIDALLSIHAARRRTWEDGWSIFFTRSADLGRTWEPPRILSRRNGPALRPSISLAPPYLHLVWFDGRHGNAEIYHRLSLDGGTTFGPEQRLSFSVGASQRPSVAAFGRRVHVSWVEEGIVGNAPTIWYRAGTSPRISATPTVTEME